MLDEYSEVKLVQEPTAKFINEVLGWDSKYAFTTEVLDENGTLGRKHEGEAFSLAIFAEASKASTLTTRKKPTTKLSTSSRPRAHRSIFSLQTGKCMGLSATVSRSPIRVQMAGSSRRSSR